jgi:predicted NUDIX family NTP pyrophosphohydrolase
MPKISAGILLYRHTATGLEVFLVHPGGPFWERKDHGAWSIPKGETDEGEELLAAARRELHEETGFKARGTAVPLGHVRQSGGKIVHAWAIKGDVDPKQLRSNTFKIEWPPGSKRIKCFPEVDKAEWFSLAEAGRRVVSAQVAFLDALAAELNSASQK